MSRYTNLTEIMTGVGMLDGPDPTAILPMAEPELANVDPETWAAVIEQMSDPDALAVAESALANGRFFLRARDALRGRRPLRVEWKGPQRVPGDEVAPVDLLVDHVYLVSCKYLSAITVNASPSHLFDRLLTGPHGQRAQDWFDLVSPDEHRALFAAARHHLGLGGGVLSPTELDKSERRAMGKALAGTRWPADLQAGYDELIRAVSAASADRWRRALSDATGPDESMLWRLLRIGSAPYYVLGTSGADSLRLRVGTPWDWRQCFRLRRFDVEPATGGQPRVDWAATYDDRAAGQQRVVAGHVEIRWSHGRFSGPPEAKVYLDTPHSEVPGYFDLR